MSGKQTMTWNGDAHAKLLLAILKVSDVKLDFEAVAEQLTTDTITCTPRAVQEHLKKLRKIAKAEADPNPPPAKAPAKAPTKGAAASSAGVKKTRKPAAGNGKGKKGKSAALVEGVEDRSIKTETRSDGNESIMGYESAELAQEGSEYESNA